MTLPRELLDILVCPRCKGPLCFDPTHQRLGCKACRLNYPVRDGIPVMLVEEAEPWQEE